MMENADKVNMEIKIGSQTVGLTVPFLRQDFVRDTEKGIDDLYSDLRRRFPMRDERALMAMLIYQYASNYRDLRALYEKALGVAIECDNKLGAIEL